MDLVLLVFCLIGFCRSIPNPGGIRVQLPDSPITINMEPQNINVESPVSRIKPPKARFEAPKTGLEPVRARLEPPKARMEPPKARMQPPKARIESPKARIESGIESPNSVVAGIDSSRSKLELGKTTFESKQGCRNLLDVVAVVDGSDSITSPDFQTLKSSLVDLMDGLQLAEDQARFGVVLYSSDVAAEIPLSADRRQLKSKILGLRHPRDGTRTDLGIKSLRKMFSQQGRPGVPRVGVVITDGISKNPRDTAKESELARSEGVKLYAVGVSDLIAENELKSIASNGTRVLSVTSFDQLKLVFSSLVVQVCPTTTTTTTTTTPAPTTTTTTKTTTTLPPTTKKPKNPCDSCKMSNGAGFTRHPTDCSKFIQCYFGNNGLKKMSYQECPWGNFWDQSSLTCQPAHRVKCPTDRCLDPEVLTYDLPGSCRSFWACDGGESIPMCCPYGTSYHSGIGCLPDNKCKDPCPPRPTQHLNPRAIMSDKIDSKMNAPLREMSLPGLKPKLNIKPRKPVCDKKAVRGDSNSFEQFVERYGWIKMPCAPGTQYSQADCECTTTVPYSSNKTAECTSKLKLNFSDGFEDERDKRPVYIVNNNVSFSGGVAKFSGKSRLRVPQLSNVDYGDSVMLRIRFRDSTNSSGRPQALISNADCGNNASILIAKDKDRIIFGAHTENGGYNQIELPKPKTEWKNVKYSYNLGRLQGSVNTDKVTRWIPGGGKIQSRPCALQIGHGENLDDFEGDIDDLEIFTQCMPPDDMYFDEDYGGGFL
ncbi:protein PIF-like isoform X2 [Crassostrea angulata]|uniref:protein PIF-like isoform X2 n=1 Tax=Magallana angulata TaxID=2784310 RepID=UPI0022B0B3CD|nr:protein PIF-like isoform X2 [Crassostrea angulata]